MKRLIALLATALSLATASAQTAADIRGSVTDSSNGQPVAGAVVKIVDGEGRILRYTIVDRTGAFRIANVAPPADARLTVSMLGYAEAAMRPADPGRPIVVALDPAATAIREVVVRAPRISMQGDTISYDARRFTEIKDKSLSDILKKMPGIEVSESGQVKYQGEAINKLYIDGVDMLGGRYSLATENIAPQDVRSVEVMENHQPRKVLRGVEFSDKAALNIRMRERVKSQWVGSAQAGAGFSPALWNGSLFAMCIDKRYSAMQSVRSDNTGLDIGAQTASLIAEGDTYSLPRYIGVATSAAPLDRNRTRFNTSHLYNTANTVHLSADYDLHIGASYLYDRLTSQNSSQTTYFVGDNRIDVSDAARAADRSHTLTVEARLTANTDRFYLNDVLSTEMRWREAWRSAEGTYPNIQRADTPQRQVRNRLEFIRRFGKHTLTIRSTNAYLHSPQSLDIERDTCRQHQYIRGWAFRSNTSAAMAWRLGRFNLALDASFTQLVRGLRSSAEGLGEAIEPTCNDLRIGMSQIQIGPVLHYVGRRLNASLRIPAAYALYSISDRADGHTPRRICDPTAAPSLTVKYLLSSMLSLSGSASCTIAPLDQTRFASGAIMSDYRYITRGYFIPQNDSSASFGLRAEYKNPLAALFINANAGYTSSRLHASPSQDFAGDYIIVSAVPARSRTSTRYVRIGASKGIDALKGKIGINTQWTLTRTGMVQQGEYNPYDSQRISVEPTLNMRITKWCSVDYRLAYTLSTLDVGITQQSVATSDLNQSLTATLQTSKALRFGLTAEHYRTQIAERRHKNMALLDAEAAYSFKQGWELSLAASNLLDQREYAYSLFDGLSRASASYRIRPRNILLKLYVKF